MSADTITKEDLAKLTADNVVDARGTGCPGPLLEAKKAMPSVTVGGVIEVWSSDPQTKADISAWSAKVGHAFLGHLVADGYDRVFVRRVK